MKSLSLVTPHVIFVIGKPGAGKTFFASKFSDTFGAPFVEADKIRRIIAPTPSFAPDEQSLVDQLVMQQMNELFKTKKTFIVEAATEAKIDRLGFAKLARANDYEPFVIWLQTDDDTAYVRATRASRTDKTKLLMPAARYEQLVKRFTAPSDSEKAVVISGKHTYASQARTVLRRLAAPNRPADAAALQVPHRQSLKSNSIKVS